MNQQKIIGTSTEPLVPNKDHSNENIVRQFVHEQLPKVYSLCLRLCGNKEDAEDLCQEAFIRALKGLDKFKNESLISTWLYRIVLNTWKNQVRYEKRRQFKWHFSIFKNDETNENPLFQLVDPSLSPEIMAEKMDKKKQVLGALEKMDIDLRTIIVLRDIEDKSYEEIADVLEMKLGTIKSRLSRAREAFREEIRRGGGGLS